MCAPSISAAFAAFVFHAVFDALQWPQQSTGISVCCVLLLVLRLYANFFDFFCVKTQKNQKIRSGHCTEADMEQIFIFFQRWQTRWRNSHFIWVHNLFYLARWLILWMIVVLMVFCLMEIQVKYVHQQTLVDIINKKKIKKKV